MKKAVILIETESEQHMENLRKLILDYQERHMPNEEEAVVIFEDDEARDKVEFDKWTEDLIQDTDMLSGDYMSN